MKFSVPAVLLLSLTPSAFGDHAHDYGWKTLGVKLPKALSDHTASADETGMVFLAGGCDDPNGNMYIPVDENDEGGFFACGSLSKSLYVFDPEDEDFETLSNLPRERYRHSSAIVDGQLWLVGGRTLFDDLIAEVDVYDIASKTWKNYTLPEQYVVSDHTSFAKAPFIYVVGGYDANYTAQSNVARIDVTSQTSGETLMVDEAGSLLEARGDIIGVASTDGEKAFVAGGFTHANDFCAPLGSAEEFSFAQDSWTALPNVLVDRGEIVLVELANHVFAMGGERQIENICDLTNTTDPAELTVGLEVVETFDRDVGSWELIGSFPDHRFRFAATGVEEKGLVYAFGGQTAYDNGCTCFKTTNDVSVFGDIGHSHGGDSASPIMSISASLAMSAIGLVMVMAF